jgi:hypothetical protein
MVDRWLYGIMGSCSLGAERVQALAVNGRGKQPLHAGRDERREPEDALQCLDPRTPTKQSKATLLYASKPSSHQAFKQANKQTTSQPFSELRERVSGCSDAGRPAARQAARCREGPRTRWQRSGVRKLIPTGSPQLLLLDVFGSMSLHSPLPRMGTLGRDFERWQRIGQKTTITRRGRTRF